MAVYRKYTPRQVSEIAGGIRQKLADRLLTPAALRPILAAFKFRDPDGVIWTKGPQSGAWYRYQNGSWARAAQPHTPLDGDDHLSGWLTLAPTPVNTRKPEEQDAPPAHEDPVDALEAAAQRAWQAYARGEINSDQAETLLEDLYLLDPRGAVWAYAPGSGQWYALWGERWTPTSGKPDLGEWSAGSGAEETPRFCGNCGKSLDGNKFCVHCGTPAPAASASAEGDPDAVEAAVLALARGDAPAWPESVAGAWEPPTSFPEQVTVCQSCGAPNVGADGACLSCGTALPDSGRGTPARVESHSDRVSAPAREKETARYTAPGSGEATSPKSEAIQPWKLTVMEGPDAGRSFPIGGEMLIGRAPDCDISLNDGQISRRQATIVQQGSTYHVIDRNSTNGTFVNGTRISRPTQLSPGDVVAMGNSRMMVEGDAGRCSNCGAALRPGDSFCRECGQPVQGKPHAHAQKPSTAPAMSPPAQPRQQPPPQRPRGAGYSPPQASQPPSAPPPQASAPPPTTPAKKKKRRSWLRTCLLLFVLLACGLVTVAGVGYYLFSTGALSRRTVLNTVGLGAGEIALVNIADSPLDARLYQLDTESGDPELAHSGRLEPLDMGGFGGIEPGRYELVLSTLDGFPPESRCTMQIASGDQYQFVVVPEGIAVTLNQQGAQAAAELDVLTSPLCAR